MIYNSLKNFYKIFIVSDDLSITTTIRHKKTNSLITKLNDKKNFLGKIKNFN